MAAGEEIDRGETREQDERSGKSGRLKRIQGQQHLRGRLCHRSVDSPVRGSRENRHHDV